MKVAVLLLAFLYLSVMAEECSISGRAILWAYDSCYWKYETDGSIHPEVIECVDASQNEIRGYCSSLAFLTQLKNGIWKSLILIQLSAWKTIRHW